MTPADLTAVGTVVTAFVAVVAAGFTGWQVWELRRTREEQARPFVIVDLQPSPVWSNYFNLIVENVGTTVARDIHIEFLPELQSSSKNNDIGSALLLREGIPMLPPGRRLHAFFDVSHERINSDLPMRYDVVVTLSNARGTKQEPQRYIIDLSYMYGLTEITEYGIHHVAKALQEIERSVKKWSGPQGRLKVWVRDEDQHRLDQRVEHALTGRHPTLGTTQPPEFVMALGRNVIVRSLVQLVRGIVNRLQKPRSVGGSE